jgi:hypothetical protein
MSAEIIKPWLRGRDIKRWEPEWADLYLIAIQNSGDEDAENARGPPVPRQRHERFLPKRIPPFMTI